MYMRDYCVRSSNFVSEYISVAIEVIYIYMLAMNVRTWLSAALQQALASLAMLCLMIEFRLGLGLRVP